MRVAVLGPLEVLSDDGVPVTVPGAKERLLLAALVAAVPRGVSTDRLVDVLWDGEPPASARKSLQAHLVRLRTALEPDRPHGSTGRCVVRQGAGYALALDPGGIDALRMTDLAAQGRARLAAGDVVGAGVHFGAALELWRGEPYSDWPDAEFAETERRRLAEVHRGALAGYLEGQLALGRQTDVLPRLQELVESEPLREEWWRLLMLALYRAGRQADALATARRVRALLADELGAEPGPALRRTEAAILAQDPALDRTVAAGAAGRPVACPYKGLAAYQAADAPLFHGRSRLVSRLVARLVDARLLVVSGPSGAGKSSVVRAGLVPALANGAVPGSEQWEPVIVTPGRRPVEAIAHLTAGGKPPAAVLLVVDQLEQLWAPGTDPADRTAFFDAVLEVLDGGTVERCVAVVRGDHVGRLAEHAAFAERVGGALVLVSAPTADELRAIVREPARAVGLEVDGDLLDVVVADVVGQVGALPLLSAALVGTWECRRDDRLTLAGYLEAGGVAGALKRSAESVYGGLPEPAQEVARRLFVQLADVDDGGALVRRQLAVAELELDGERRTVVEAFVARRLLTIDDGRLEVAHEALLSAWPRLARWLEDDAAGRAVRRRLSPDARDWQDAGRPEDELYRGARLEAALDWANGPDADLPALEQEFLDASKAQADAELRREVAAHRRTRRVAAGIAIVCVLALVGAAFAVRAQRAAERAAVVAEAEQLARLSATVAPMDQAVLLAAQSLQQADTPSTRQRLSAAVIRYRRAVHSIPMSTVASGAALANSGRTLFVSDGNGLRVIPVDADAGPTTRFAFPLVNRWRNRSADDASRTAAVMAAVGSTREGPWLWVVEDGHIATDRGAEIGGPPFGVSFTADDALLNVFVSSPPGPDGRSGWRMRQVDPATGAGRDTLMAGSLPPGDTPLVHPSDDGSTAVLWGASGVEPPLLLDLVTGSQVTMEAVDIGSAVPDYRALATGAVQMATGAYQLGEGQVVLYNRSGHVTQTIQGAQFAMSGAVRDVVLAPDRSWAAIVGDSPTVLLWDIDPESGFWSMREALPGHGRPVMVAEVDPGGERLVTAAWGDRAIVWEVADRIPARPDTSPSSLLRAACRIAGRDLTHIEWNRYLPGRTWTSTCTDLD